MVRQLRDAGHEALWAGGCVRDQLLGRVPKDYDVATSALPDTVREVFGKKRTLAIGASFGVITVLGPPDVGPIEVATFRSDGAYSDGRHPDGVVFTDAKHDAERRDFTINGLFYDPMTEEVIDFVGGREDLETGIIRAIGDPAERFAEDKLRMLRAVRFASTLEFGIAPDTAAAIAANAAEIEQVSAERIGAELRRILTCRQVVQAARLLNAVGLLALVIPEFTTIEAEDFRRLDTVFQRLDKLCVATSLTCLLANTSTPSGIRAACMRLKFTKKESERAAWLMENYTKLANAEKQPWSAIQPLLAAEGGSELVSVFEALHDECPASRYCREKLDLPPEELDPPPLVTGAELIRRGHRPGPNFAAVLSAARASQLDGQAENAEQALQIALERTRS